MHERVALNAVADALELLRLERLGDLNALALSREEGPVGRTEEPLDDCRVLTAIDALEADSQDGRTESLLH